MIWKLEVVTDDTSEVRAQQKSSLYSRTLPVTKRGKQTAAAYIISIAWSTTLCSYYYIETIFVVPLIKIIQNIISDPSGALSLLNSENISDAKVTKLQTDKRWMING